MFSRFGYATGWRKGSIASLAWTDVGTDVLYLRAQNSKTRKPETIPLVGQLKEIIDRRRETRVLESSTGEARFAKYVFHRDGEPVGDFRKAWATACKKAGVTCRLFHDLRRSAAKAMMDAGVPIAVGMKITGHRTASNYQLDRSSTQSGGDGWQVIRCSSRPGETEKLPLFSAQNSSPARL